MINLQQRVNELEEVLIMLVRTYRYDDQDNPGDSRASQETFVAAMKEARTLLGLEHRSVLTRTEPRT